MRPEGERRPDPSAEQLRADLRAWAGANAHDPGVALLQLFSYLSDALGALQDDVTDDTYATSRRYLSVRMQQGRVAVDTDWREGTPGAPRWGLYRGAVVNVTDPLGRGRVQVQVPSVSVSARPWAMPCLDPGSAPVLPAVGATVWVAYEEGDEDLPVWLGVLA